MKSFLELLNTPFMIWFRLAKILKMVFNEEELCATQQHKLSTNPSNQRYKYRPNDDFLQYHTFSNYCIVHLQHPCKQKLHDDQSIPQVDKKVKSFSFTPLDERYANIFERLKQMGFYNQEMGSFMSICLNTMIYPRVVLNTQNIKGHDIEDCHALNLEIECMIIVER